MTCTFANDLRAHNSLGNPMIVEWLQSDVCPETNTPIRFGLSLPRGEFRHVNLCQIELPEQVQLFGQLSPLGYWDDRSVRWALAECILPAGAHLNDPARVTILSGEAAYPVGDLVQTRRTDAGFELENGLFLARFHSKNGSWEIVRGNTSLAQIPLPEIVDDLNSVHSARITQFVICSPGPIRSTVQIRGEYPRWPGLFVTAEWSLFAGSSRIRARVTLHNSRPAQHRGGLWDLGDPGSILIKDFSQLVHLATGLNATTSYRCEPDQPWSTTTGSFELYQESSGGAHWNSRNHVNRIGIVPIRFRGYMGHAGDQQLAGTRGQPAVQLSNANLAVSAEIENFWQQFPKLISVESNRIRLGIFPAEFSDLHEIQGGEQKSHDLWLAVQFPESQENLSEIIRNGICFEIREQQPAPMVVHSRSLSPDVIPGIPDWRDVDDRKIALLDSLAEEFLTAPRGLFANRELVDDYGWRNYGDVHADHEEQYYTGTQPLVSHYNNQFDMLCGFLLQHLRTGNVRWMQLADSLARHVIDIDVYHTSQDRPAYSGGLFWFTDHYLHAETSTHRTYSRHNQLPGRDYGGGPSAAHNFTTGLLLYHLLTGDSQARDTVLELSNWVIAQDDGTRTIWGLVDSGPTGIATASSYGGHHAPSRTGGNSINALLDGWLLTQDDKYLNYAESLIRRCVHPHEDIGALKLLDIEKSWSYPVFLVSLDKYLRCKEGTGQVDSVYAYARASLVHYGQWMLANEQPYFDRVTEMEYPTEAWAAQEFRKANALRLAGRYAEDGLAQQMCDRGDELAERAWADLLRFSTKTATRAMAVVLVEGLRDAELTRRKYDSPPQAPQLSELPPHQVFLAQRERIRARLRSPVGIVSLLANALNPLHWPRLLNHR